LRRVWLRLRVVAVVSAMGDPSSGAEQLRSNFSAR
jgi:hypothetical protein